MKNTNQNPIFHFLKDGLNIEIPSNWTGERFFKWKRENQHLIDAAKKSLPARIKPLKKRQTSRIEKQRFPMTKKAIVFFALVRPVQFPVYVSFFGGLYLAKLVSKSESIQIRSLKIEHTKYEIGTTVLYDMYINGIGDKMSEESFNDIYKFANNGTGNS